MSKFTFGDFTRSQVAEVVGGDQVFQALLAVDKFISPKKAASAQQESLRRAITSKAVPSLEWHVRGVKPDFHGVARGKVGRQVPAKFRGNRNLADGTEGVAFMQGKSAPLVHLMEFGADPHEIAVKTATMLSNWKTAKGRYTVRTFGRMVDHPGSRATPTHGPAFDASYDTTMNEFRDSLGKRLVRLANRLNKGTKGLGKL